jgi:hypothetical protein
MTHVYTARTDVAKKSFGKFKIASMPRHVREAPAPAAVDPEERFHEVAKAAYFHAEHRGFLPGYELQDWLSAEAELDKLPTQVS